MKPIDVEVAASGFVNSFISVRAEIVPLRLEQVLRKTSISVAVIIGQGGGKGGGGNAEIDRNRNDLSPIRLVLLDAFLKI